MAVQPIPEPAEAQPYDNFIRGRWAASVSGRTAESRNPADNRDLVGRFALSDGRDVDAAALAAADAEKTWSSQPVPARAAYLRKAASILETRQEGFARLITREMGKPLAESLDEMRDTVNFAYYVAEEGRRFFGKTIPSEKPGRFCYTLRSPLGVVGLITPWNFPVMLPAWKIFPALLAGNAAIFKPATETSVVAAWLVEVFEDAKLPAGVLNLVMGRGDEAGRALVEQPQIRAISFTGSAANGWSVAARCAELRKRVSLELGGKNPLIVLPDADLDLAVEGAAKSVLTASGQMCTAAGHLLIHRDILEEFTERLKNRVARMKVGPGSDPAVEVGPVINRQQLERITSLVKGAQDNGAKLLSGGEALEGPEYQAGNFISPVILTDISPEMPAAREEVFGPVALITPVDSLEQAIERANAGPYGLAAVVYTRDLASAMRAADRLRAGVIYINGPSSDAEPHLPFGGAGSSGNGFRQGGPTMLDEFSEWKTVSLDSGAAAEP